MFRVDRKGEKESQEFAILFLQELPYKSAESAHKDECDVVARSGTVDSVTP